MIAWFRFYLTTLSSATAGTIWVPTSASGRILSGWCTRALPHVRISLDGYRPRLNVALYDPADVYPSAWHGPEIDVRRPFELTVAIDPALGPGGVLARVGNGPYSSLTTDGPYGYKAGDWPAIWETSAEMQVISSNHTPSSDS